MALRFLRAGAPRQSRSAPASSVIRLSWWGRAATVVFLLPGLAAALCSIYLPNSDQGGVLSTAAVSFYFGAVVVLTAPAWAFMHACWVSWLRADVHDPSWDARRAGRGPRRDAVITVALMVGNALAASWFAVLGGHAGVEQVTSSLFGLVVIAHFGLVIQYRR
jgi:hypothetical protein